MPRPAWLAIGAAGAALAVASVAPLVVALTACCALAGAISLAALGRTKPARTTAAIALGVLALGLRAGFEPSAAGPARELPAGDGPWVGVVQSVGATRAGARPAIVQLETSPPLLVAATLPWYPPAAPSDRVELRGRIRPPPDDADYGAYLVRIGAAGTLRVEGLELLPAEGSLAATLEGLRRAAADGLSRAIAEPEAGLAAGVLIGLRDRVDRDLAADFTIAGASHVVAISGWNIAIVASTLGAIAGGLQRRRRAVLTAVAIVLYVAFVGPSPSVVRAGVMAGVALLARELGRPGSAAAALGWAVTGLLLLDPAWVDDAGFRLSVLATAGILAWGSSLTDRLAGPQAGRVRRWVGETLGVSLAAQAATTPIVLLEFGRLSLVAPAVNLIVVPLVPPAMATGALALGSGLLVGAGLPALCAVIAGLPAWLLYAAIVGTVRAGAALPLASLELAGPWDTVAAGLSLAVIVGIARWGNAIRAWLGRRVRRPRVHRRSEAARRPPRSGSTDAREPRWPRAARLAFAALAASTLGLALAVGYRPDGIPRVVAFDVGQGDAILIEGGRGGRMVVDGGPDPNGLLIQLDQRLPPWDHRIDILVLTHPHEDHAAGLLAVLQRYRVGRVYESGLAGNGPGARAWAALFATGGPPRGRLATGDRLGLDGIRLRVLWPDPGAVPARAPPDGKSINNTSVVLLGETASRRFLLMGDLEEDLDPTLVSRGLPRVDVLKVAHHGSRTATTGQFLDAVRPAVAVISVGTDNAYGHPAPQTLQRLRERGIRTYRTDLDGTVEVALGADAIQVRTERAANEAPVSTAAIPASGRAEGPRYHRVDADLTALSDRRSQGNRSPRLLLGRRRVRPGGGGRGVPARRHALSRRRTGALAPRGRAHRARPPPGRDPGAPRHRLHVRWGQHRDRARRRRPCQKHRGPRGAAGHVRDGCAGQRARDRRGDRVRRP